MFDLEMALVDPAALARLERAAVRAAGLAGGVSDWSAAQMSDEDVAHAVTTAEGEPQWVADALVALMSWCRSKGLPLAQAGDGPTPGPGSEGAAPPTAPAPRGPAPKAGAGGPRKQKQGLRGWSPSPEGPGGQGRPSASTGARVLRDTASLMSAWKELRASTGVAAPVDVLLAAASAASLSPGAPGLDGGDDTWLVPSAATVTPAEWVALAAVAGPGTTEVTSAAELEEAVMAAGPGHVVIAQGDDDGGGAGWTPASTAATAAAAGWTVPSAEWWSSPLAGPGASGRLALSGGVRLQAVPGGAVASAEAACEGDLPAAAALAASGALRRLAETAGAAGDGAARSGVVWLHCTSAAQAEAVEEAVEAAAGELEGAPGGRPRVASLAWHSLSADPGAVSTLALLRAAADPGDAVSLAQLLASGLYAPDELAAGGGTVPPSEVTLAALRQASVRVAAAAAEAEAGGSSFRGPSAAAPRLGEALVTELRRQGLGARGNAPPGVRAAALAAAERLLGDVDAVRRAAAGTTLAGAVRVAGARVAMAAARRAVLSEASLMTSSGGGGPAFPAGRLGSGPSLAEAVAAAPTMSGVRSLSRWGRSDDKDAADAADRIREASRDAAAGGDGDGPAWGEPGAAAAEGLRHESFRTALADAAAGAAASVELGVRALETAATYVQASGRAVRGAEGRLGAALEPTAVAALAAAADRTRGPGAADEAIAGLDHGGADTGARPLVVVTSGRGWAPPAASGGAAWARGDGWGVLCDVMVVVGASKGRLRSAMRAAALPGAALASCADANAAAWPGAGAFPAAPMAGLAATREGHDALERSSLLTAMAASRGSVLFLHPASTGTVTSATSSGPGGGTEPVGRRVVRDSLVDELLGAPLPPRQWPHHSATDDAADNANAAAAAAAAAGARPTVVFARQPPTGRHDQSGGAGAAPASPSRLDPSPPTATTAPSAPGAPPPLVALSASRLSKFRACPLSYALQYRANVAPDVARSEAEWSVLARGQGDQGAADALAEDPRWQAIVHGRAAHAAAEAVSGLWLRQTFLAARALELARPGLPEPRAARELAAAILGDEALTPEAVSEAAAEAATKVVGSANASRAAGGQTARLRGKGSALACSEAASEAARRELQRLRLGLAEAARQVGGGDADADAGPKAGGASAGRLPVMVEVPFALPLAADGSILPASAMPGAGGGPAPPAVLRGVIDRIDAAPAPWLRGALRMGRQAAPPAVVVPGPGGWLWPAAYGAALRDTAASLGAPLATVEALLGRPPAADVENAIPVGADVTFAAAVFGDHGAAGGGDGRGGAQPIVVEFKTGRAGGGKSGGASSAAPEATMAPPPPAAARTPQVLAYTAAAAAMFGSSPADVVVVSLDSAGERAALPEAARPAADAGLAAIGRADGTASSWRVPGAADILAAEAAAADESSRGDPFPARPDRHTCSMCAVNSVCPHAATRARPIGALASGASRRTAVHGPSSFPALDRR